jgi:hypothetical protein
VAERSNTVVGLTLLNITKGDLTQLYNLNEACIPEGSSLTSAEGGVDMAVLVGASVSFHTNDEDKDDDTHVTITARQGDGTIAARIDDDFGHFNDHSDNGPFGLKVINQSTKDTLEEGNVTIRVDPNGNDTWRFNFAVDLVFDDGSHLLTDEDGLELTQDRQQQMFGIG